MDGLVRKWRFFPPWREAAHEAWLQEQSRRGLHLAEVAWTGWHAFRSGPPQDLVYRWSVRPNEDRDNYRQLFRDAGWEIAAVTIGFTCWRKSAAAGDTEVFTESATKSRQYRRHALWLAGFAVFFAAAAGADGNNVITLAWQSCAAAALAYAAVRLGWHAVQLERRKV